MKSIARRTEGRLAPRTTLLCSLFLVIAGIAVLSTPEVAQAAAPPSPPPLVPATTI